MRIAERALNYLGGVPKCIVPDNLKSGVNEACRYEPELNRSYQELAEHYSVAIIPARVKKTARQSQSGEGSTGSGALDYCPSAS